MCGVFCALSWRTHLHATHGLLELLKHRGPDETGQYLNDPHETGHRVPCITMQATVLGLRGETVPQPIRDCGNAHSLGCLCWNGELWRYKDLRSSDMPDPNDAVIVSRTFADACARGGEDRNSRCENMMSAVSQFRGPFAFVYYDHEGGFLYFGRDSLGRRSLLQRRSALGEFFLSSVSDGTTGGENGSEWTEVNSCGIYYLNFMSKNSQDSLNDVHCVPYRLSEDKPRPPLPSVVRRLG